jgi:hypothetical protein
MLKRLMVFVAAMAVLSCTASKPPPSPAQPGAARTFPQAPTEQLPLGDVPPPGWPVAGSYRIDSSQSELRLLVYRAGALASLGHNHVIQNRSVNGLIDVAPTLAASSFSFSAAVSAFVVDDAQARAEEGEDFSSDVSDSAKLGTWNNMTGPDLLKAEKYPVVGVRSVRVELLKGAPTATVIVSVAGHESSLVLPFALHKEAYGLSATASFELNQSAIGLTPFSLMLGALAVRDTMVVKLKVIAVLEGPRLGTPHELAPR